MENVNKLIKLIDKYKKKLGLDDYRIETIMADDEHLLSDRNILTKPHKSNYLAEVRKCYYNLREFDIVFNKCALKEDLKDTVKHELLHILFWSLCGKMEALIELGGFDTQTKVRFYRELEDEEHKIIEKIIKHIK